MEKSKKMKEYFCIFLFLIGGCAFEVDRMLPYHCNGKNNDMQIKMNGTDWENSQQYFNNIMIEKNGEPVLLIQHSTFSTDIISFFDGQVKKIQQYNIYGKKIAECSVKNGQPDSGTIWALTLGLKGVKQSLMITYKDGRIISETPYKEDLISKLLELKW